MLAAALVALLLPEPIDLDTITLDRARALHGRRVDATFPAATPAYTLGGVTVAGAAERGDGVERTAVLRGIDYDADAGRRVDVVGRLRVIGHEAAVVNGALVPARFEIRVDEE